MRMIARILHVETQKSHTEAISTPSGQPAEKCFRPADGLTRCIKALFSNNASGISYQAELSILWVHTCSPYPGKHLTDWSLAWEALLEAMQDERNDNGYETQGAMLLQCECMI